MFLLVSAYLGCPGQNPDSCKTVVVEVILLVSFASVTGVSRSFFHNVTFYAHTEEPIRVRHTWRAQTVTSTFPVTWPRASIDTCVGHTSISHDCSLPVLVIQSLACTETRRIECANVIGKE